MMEGKKDKGTRIFRGQAAIIKLLQERLQSGQSIKSFCAAHGIAEGTFHNWKQKYSASSASSSTGFAPLQIMSAPGLFAMVGSIKIFQPVSAAYLKELLA